MARSQGHDIVNSPNVVALEHLLARARPDQANAADVVFELLQVAPDVRVLATSRSQLGVPGEHLLPLEGMDYPAQLAEDIEGAASFSAIRLFASGARRVRPEFELTAEVLPHVIRICQVVQGMPLAILLAAAWVDVLSPFEIAAELAFRVPGKGIDVLALDGQGMSAGEPLWGQRHRSMRAVFDHSWALLGQRERDALARLSVFRGGCTRQAAEQVAGVSARDLRALIAKSLLHRTPAGRYEVHELLRQYAAERLESAPSAAEAARDGHAAYYVAAMEKWGVGMRGSEQQVTFAEMSADLENARAAWEWLLERGDTAQLRRVLGAMHGFHLRLSRLQEGEALFAAAAARLPVTAPGAGPILSIVLTYQGAFALRLERRERAHQLLEQSHAVLDGLASTGPDLEVAQAHALLWRGLVSFDVHLTEAARLSAQSLALYRALGDRWMASLALLILGHAAFYRGDYREAEERYRESLAIRRSLDDGLGVAEALTGLAHVVLMQRPEEAEPLRREHLAIYEKLGNQGGIAEGLHQLGLTLLYTGKFAKAQPYLEGAKVIYSDLGMSTMSLDVAAGLAHVHLGQYESARAPVQRGLASARESGNPRMTALSLVAAGHLALVEAAFAEAQRALQQAAGMYRTLGQLDYMGWAVALLGYAALGLGQRVQARRHLCAALRTAVDLASFRPLYTALPAVALLYADEGNAERATELAALTSRLPYVANSQWFADMAGQQIAAVSAGLRTEDAEASRARGRARDLWATAAELLVELEA